MNPFPNLHDVGNLEKLEEAAKRVANEIENDALIPGTTRLANFKDDGSICPNCAMGFIFHYADLLERVCPDQSYAAESPAEWFEYASPLREACTNIFVWNDARPDLDKEKWKKKVVWHIRDFAQECARELEAK